MAALKGAVPRALGSEARGALASAPFEVARQAVRGSNQGMVDLEQHKKRRSRLRGPVFKEPRSPVQQAQGAGDVCSAAARRPVDKHRSVLKKALHREGLLQESVGSGLFCVCHVLGKAPLAGHKNGQREEAREATDMLAKLVPGRTWQPEIDARDVEFDGVQVEHGSVEVARCQYVQLSLLQELGHSALEQRVIFDDQSDPRRHVISRQAKRPAYPTLRAFIVKALNSRGLTVSPRVARRTQ
jgi:hypothetical protein